MRPIGPARAASCRAAGAVVHTVARAAVRSGTQSHIGASMVPKTGGIKSALPPGVGRGSERPQQPTRRRSGPQTTKDTSNAAQRPTDGYRRPQQPPATANSRSNSHSDGQQPATASSHSGHSGHQRRPAPSTQQRQITQQLTRLTRLTQLTADVGKMQDCDGLFPAEVIKRTSSAPELAPIGHAGSRSGADIAT